MAEKSRARRAATLLAQCQTSIPWETGFALPDLLVIAQRDQHYKLSHKYLEGSRTAQHARAEAAKLGSWGVLAVQNPRLRYL